LAAVLPEAVRLRVVALAAEALGAIGSDGLPPALRRVAAFTPQRRARVAGTQIALALEADERFRERVAGHVRAQLPGVVGPLHEGVPAPAADPVELAALAYLLRPDGWREVVERAAERTVAQQVETARETERAQIDRLRQQLEAARADLRKARDRARDQVARLKDENTELRRRLAEVRQRERDTRAAAETSGEESGRVEGRARALLAEADAETRRLRARVVELEQQLAGTRRGARDDRGATTTRTRLLVDTLADAVRGLRRELALPAVDVLPADLVDAVDPDRPSPADSTGRALRVDDPVLLDQLLALPRVHLVVDGYNVTKTGYPTLALDRQRQRLLGDLAPLVARTGAEVTVVFDGADLQHVPPVAGPRGVRVRFSQPGVIADELIRRLVAAEPQGRPLVVVSTDREVVDDVIASGARAVPSATLLALLART
jgi:predicted RNA-binding protein with PIN domain